MCGRAEHNQTARAGAREELFGEKEGGGEGRGGNGGEGKGRERALHVHRLGSTPRAKVGGGGALPFLVISTNLGGINSINLVKFSKI